VVETSRAPAAGSAGAITWHGFVDGELIIRFTPAGERAVAEATGKPPGTLRFGVPSLDRLNVKYRATELVPIPDDGRRAYLLRLSPDANVLRAAEEYVADPLVLGAEPHYTLRIPKPSEEPEAVRTEVRPRGTTRE
jgi:hypothetical protein